VEIFNDVNPHIASVEHCVCPAKIIHVSIKI
jgi:hypothetical protein